MTNANYESFFKQNMENFPIKELIELPIDIQERYLTLGNRILFFTIITSILAVNFLSPFMDKSFLKLNFPDILINSLFGMGFGFFIFVIISFMEASPLAISNLFPGIRGLKKKQSILLEQLSLLLKEPDFQHAILIKVSAELSHMETPDSEESEIKKNLHKLSFDFKSACVDEDYNNAGQLFITIYKKLLELNDKNEKFQKLVAFDMIHQKHKEDLGLIKKNNQQSFLSFNEKPISSIKKAL